MRKRCTAAERCLWRRLRLRRLSGFFFRRQHPVGPFVVDFVCRRSRLIIELDGECHQERREADRERTVFLEGQGYTVLRFTNTEVEGDMRTVLKRIACELQVGDHLSS